MKKILKENKGFSLVELLVALLIMAVIAGTAITLFGGVLDTSKGRADAETAENIKRAILTYINASGDSNLSCLGVDEDDDTTHCKTILDRISAQFEITTSEVVFSSPASTYSGFDMDLTGNKLENPAAGGSGTVYVESTDLTGKYGPFLDVTKDSKPTQSNTAGWVINIDPVTQAITVKTVEGDPTTDADNCRVIIGDDSETP